MENRIKEQQLYLFADRTSCHQWWANQFRLLLASLAYVLLARIFHEKEMANPFQAYKIRLNANSKKGIRRDRLYTHPTRFPRFQTS